MMSTLRYIISILTLLLLPISLFAEGGEVDSLKVAPSDSVQLVHVDSTFVIQTDKKEVDSVKVELKPPVYQGTYLNLDIFNPIATAFNGGRFEFVVSADVSLWHKLYPVVEYGMMFINKDYSTFKYDSYGLFVRAGAGYNFLNNKPNRKYDHMLAVGVRYSYSNVKYTLSDAQLSSDYWKNSVVVSNKQQEANLGWVEFVVSFRIQVYKDFFMGINARVKTIAHFYEACPNYPTFIPGFGEYSKSAINFGFDYLLTYRIPSKKLREYRKVSGL